MRIEVSILPLGCAKNLVYAEIITTILENDGFSVTSDEKAADCFIIHTCAFIDDAKRESIEAILEASERKKKGMYKYIIVSSCLAQRFDRDLLQEIPEIDAIIGTGDFHRIPEVIRSLDRKNKAIFTGGVLKNGPLLMTPKAQLTPFYTSYVKISEGCLNHCSYCVIPSLRGSLKSRPTDEIYQEVQEKVNRGVKEIVLIAQDLTQFGLDRGEINGLEKLLEKLVLIDELKWIRLLYAYPSRITPGLINVIAQEEKICHYLDIPLQHINDLILKQMNRTTSSSDIRNVLEKIKSKINDICIRSTFIVGFPGETEAAFEELLAFLEEAKFDRAGFFMYSQEENTPASQMPDQISDETKNERYQQALSLQNEMSTKRNYSFVQKELIVLVEDYQKEDTYPLVGRSYREAPEVDGQIFLQGRYLPPGSFVRALIVDVDESNLYGVLLDEDREEKR